MFILLARHAKNSMISFDKKKSDNKRLVAICIGVSTGSFFVAILTIYAYLTLLRRWRRGTQGNENEVMNRALLRRNEEFQQEIQTLKETLKEKLNKNLKEFFEGKEKLNKNLKEFFEGIYRLHINNILPSNYEEVKTMLYIEKHKANIFEGELQGELLLKYTEKPYISFEEKNDNEKSFQYMINQCSFLEKENKTLKEILPKEIKELGSDDNDEKMLQDLDKALDEALDEEKEHKLIRDRVLVLQVVEIVQKTNNVTDRLYYFISNLSDKEKNSLNYIKIASDWKQNVARSPLLEKAVKDMNNLKKEKFKDTIKTILKNKEKYTEYITEWTKYLLTLEGILAAFETIENSFKEKVNTLEETI